MRGYSASWRSFYSDLTSLSVFMPTSDGPVAFRAMGRSARTLAYTRSAAGYRVHGSLYRLSVVLLVSTLFGPHEGILAPLVPVRLAKNRRNRYGINPVRWTTFW